MVSEPPEEPQSEVRAERPRFAMVPEALVYDPAVNPTALRVYAALDRHADKTTRLGWPGQAGLADKLGVSAGTVRRAIAELKAAGWVEVERRGLTQSNVYTVLMAPRTSARSDRADVRDLDRAPVAEERESLNERTPPGGQPNLAARREAAAVLLLQEEMDRRGDEIGSRAGYLRARLPAVLEEHDPLWRRLLDDDGDLTAEALAAAARPKPRQPRTPLDETVEAQTVRFARTAQEQAHQPDRDPEANQAGLAAARAEAERRRRR